MYNISNNSNTSNTSNTNYTKTNISAWTVTEDFLQDFEMPDLSTCLRLSPDGQYLMVSGTYQPTVKCYDLSDLSVKFQRGMDAEVVRFEILSEDYSKVSLSDV